MELVEAKLNETEKLRDAKLSTIGNIVHSDVPISKDEANNAVYSTWGEIPELKVDGKNLGHLYHH